MSFNIQGAVEIPLDILGSWVTEMDPTDLPPGVSPDCQDIGFTPGSCFSRPCLQKYQAQYFSTGTMVHGKTLTLPDGTKYNLTADSDGFLLAQDLLTGGSQNLFLSATNTFPSYWRSISAFGREYFAISDLLHGTDVPLQWDGTYLDRFTQDGPGASPSVTSIALPPVPLNTTGAPLTLPILNIETSGLSQGGTYLTFLVTLQSTVNTNAIFTNLALAITGNANPVFNATWAVASVLNETQFLCFCNFSAFAVGNGGVATFDLPTVGLSRTGNTVTAIVDGGHGLQVGYQVLISGVGATAFGGGVTSVVIDNEALPGLATVTTSFAHGLSPNVQVILQVFGGGIVGSMINAAVRQGDITTVTMATAHGLSAGASIQIAGTSEGTFDGAWTVASIVDQYTFTFADVDADANSSGGTVTLLWPIPQTATPDYFNVETVPSPNTFTVQITYSDGTWGAASVSFPWDGIFYVTDVVNGSVFQYQSYGPPISTSSGGTETPYGQATPGTHFLQCAFLTRQGYITRPSPPVQFVANGGQYVAVSNIPIGPDNIVARILLFTGSGGSRFFYIPVPGNVAGLTVSTSTVLNDNSTTSALLDFGDNTLFAALGTSIPGNNLAAQVVIDGALNFGFYGERILTWGQRNVIQNLLNMGFDGGFYSQTTGNPLGWDVSLNVGGVLGDPIVSRGQYQNTGWRVTIPGFNTPGNYGRISQGAYQDGYNAAILQPNQEYMFRAFVQVQGFTAGLAMNLVATLTSGSGLNSTATIPLVSSYNGFVEADFTLKTPNGIIPPDMLLSVYVQIVSNLTGQTPVVFIDEMNLVYADNPYLDNQEFVSYVNNPEALDGLTGVMGPAEDTHKVMASAVIRDTLYILTQEPTGRLHEVSGTESGEPSTWNVKEIGSNCGIVGPLALTVSQADDSSSSGGEEWFSWMSNAGVRIFSGSEPWKISQEIQEVFNPGMNAAPGGALPAPMLTTWALNDPVGRIVYFGIPYGTATAPSLVIPLSYRELDTAESIAKSPPFRPSLSGKLVATDNTRKWTRWNMTMNGAALMASFPLTETLQPTFFGGNGDYPVFTSQVPIPTPPPGFGMIYTLNSNKFTDDDYGQLDPYYVTYLFPSQDQEQQLQLGGGQKMIQYMSSFISVLGTVTFTYLVNALSNPWPLTMVRTPPTQMNPINDMEVPGGSATGQRIAVKISVAPLAGQTDCFFSLSKLTMWMKQNVRLPVRGAQ